MCIANLGVSLKVIKILLAPFSAMYWLGTTLRNFLYDRQIFKTVHFSPYVIGVGNLRVGGTGKTPMIEYLVRLLKDEHPVAILSRGYGRATKGVRLANSQDTAQTLGDEPFQFHNKFNTSGVVVAVGEERIVAVPEILYHCPKTEVILLDDAFQHRAIGTNLNILLTEYARPFYHDAVLPGGRLRESRTGAARADVIVVSKCPADLPETRIASIEQAVRKYTSQGVPVFFSGIRYLPPHSARSEKPQPLQKVLLVSGIANHAPLEEYVQQHFTLVKHLKYADHHRYTEKDIFYLQKTWQALHDPEISILTTEKDKVKLLNLAIDLWEDMPLYYLPIETFFLQSQSAFDQLVKEKVKDSILVHKNP